MEKRKGLIVAIDGPAGSGKSTVSREVADRLGFLYVDTGAMYRALTLKALREKIDLEDGKALTAMAKRTAITLEKDGTVLLDGKDVTREIRTPAVTKTSFYIARVGGVRKRMVALQRKLGGKGKTVLEGRDIGTVVFPDADRKLYLDASTGERARRRHKELTENGYDLAFNEVLDDVFKRDKKDTGRKIAPLRVARDAVVIDTTRMNIAQVVKRVLEIVGEKTQGETDARW